MPNFCQRRGGGICYSVHSVTCTCSCTILNIKESWGTLPPGKFAVHNLLVDRDGFPLDSIREEAGELIMRLPVECFLPDFSFPEGGAGAALKDCCCCSDSLWLWVALCGKKRQAVDLYLLIILPVNMNIHEEEHRKTYSNLTRALHQSNLVPRPHPAFNVSMWNIENWGWG